MNSDISMIRGGEDVCVKPETNISEGWGGISDGWGGVAIENFGGHLEQWGSLPC